MKLPRRQFLHLAADAAALPAVSRIARAQAYPTRPMTMVVPYAAGGPTDTIARIMAERMRGSLGQIIIVENVTGAGKTDYVAIQRTAEADAIAAEVRNGRRRRSWSQFRCFVYRRRPFGRQPKASSFLGKGTNRRHSSMAIFAKLKTLLRRADERAVEATWRRIGTLLDAFTPQECANYFRNAGYASI